MTRHEVIRTLFFGGQAAIVAEVLVILGIVGLLLSVPEAEVMQSHAIADLQSYETIIQDYNERSFIFMASLFLVGFAPSLAMLFVIWAWYIYLDSQGVHLLNRVLTTVGVLGAAMMILFTGLSVIGGFLLSDAIESGLTEFSEIYGFVAVLISLYILGILLLYSGYPMMLALAGWRRHLLPHWFSGLALILVLINDMVLLFGTDNPRLVDFSAGLLIVWPFLMGVVLLRRAQTLAQQDYAQRHTPPTPVSGQPMTPLTPSTEYDDNVRTQTPH